LFHLCKSSLAWILLEAEHATPQIKLVFVLGHAMLKGGRNVAMDVFAAPHGFHDSGFPQDAKVLGDIVLGNLQPFRKFAHGLRTGEQFPHDGPARLVAQGLEKWRATSRIGRFHTTEAYDLPSKLKTLEMRRDAKFPERKARRWDLKKVSVRK
jgi:hypothetical protein